MTEAYSASVWAYRNSPPLTPIMPPGAAKALIRSEAAGKVALRQVSQFVGHDRGIFGFGLGIQEQSAIDPDNAAGGGEGIDLLAVEQHEFQAAVLQLAGFAEAIHAGLDEVLELRVGQLADLAAYQAQPGTTELVLLLGRNHGRTGVAQRWQVAGHAGCGQQAGEHQQGRAQKIHAQSSCRTKPLL